MANSSPGRELPCTVSGLAEKMFVLKRIIPVLIMMIINSDASAIFGLLIKANAFDQKLFSVEFALTAVITLVNRYAFGSAF